MKVQLYGAQGSLGQCLALILRGGGHEVIAGDWRNPSAAPCDAIINAAAYNDVDGAENPENKAVLRALNVELPETLGKIASSLGVAFVQYSTDYVFDGLKQQGYREDDMPNPISAYGRSKYDGEQAALRHQGCVIRVSRLFGARGSSPHSKQSFLATMIALSKKNPELTVIDEEVGCPTYVQDVAKATVELLESGRAQGVYHLVNSGAGVTWFGFTKEAFDLLRITTPLHRARRADFPRAAKVPAFAALLNTKFRPLRPRTEALKAYFDEL